MPSGPCRAYLCGGLGRGRRGLRHYARAEQEGATQHGLHDRHRENRGREYCQYAQPGPRGDTAYREPLQRDRWHCRPQGQPGPRGFGGKALGGAAGDVSA